MFLDRVKYEDLALESIQPVCDIFLPHGRGNQYAGKIMKSLILSREE